VLRGNQPALASEHEWDTYYVLRLPMLPTSYLPVRLAQKLLFIGKAVHVLNAPSYTREGGTASSALDWDAGEMGDGGGGKGSGGGGQRLDTAPFAAALERLKRRALNVREMESEVEAIRRAVAAELWQLVVVRGGLASHLAALKGYFLLARGEYRLHTMYSLNFAAGAATFGLTAAHCTSRLFGTCTSKFSTEN
jgi:gamma-tubulin complex component 4